ncbi:FtsW/RodA/SpoVE family cell cycle protein [Thermosipho atlanticus]|uniref:Rod shape determining protein RodA n=1 Tax=Thermosipho atlanticus DSM 15807 TaxID=1123380 RepID=A0A1M5U0Q7_9BACT|nr:FtsW/RodA/SpoVE family cell cycle protein [Thermosipho atlanticus]SHH56440.1 rod shape determining protein RodA [Thermosipho atlanticus DSM 15807]
MKFTENKRFDFLLVFSVIFLMIFGLLNLYSVLRPTNNLALFYKQVLWDIFGVFVIFLVYFIKESFIKKIILPLYLISIILLVGVLVFGTRVGGSIRWYRFAGVSFQPSELSKLSLIMILAYILTHKSLKNFLISIVLLVIPVMLILKEPDLGVSVLHVFIWSIMLLFSGVSFKIIATVFGSMIGAVPILYFFFLEDYQKSRILSFLNPEKYFQSASYNVIMAKNTVGSGGIFGRGYLVSPSVNGAFVPKFETDFIFSAIAEQFGFIGSLIVLVGFGVIIFKVLKDIKDYKNSFWKLVSIGIISTFMFHVFENIGMNIGIMPVTGIPLPFLSYGGTSTFIFCFMIGLLLKAHALGTKTRKVI